MVVGSARRDRAGRRPRPATSTPRRQTEPQGRSWARRRPRRRWIMSQGDQLVRPLTSGPVKPGRKDVLMKERSVITRWACENARPRPSGTRPCRLLEAVARLGQDADDLRARGGGDARASQSEGTPDSQTAAQGRHNSWAEAGRQEGGAVALRSKCLTSRPRVSSSSSVAPRRSTASNEVLALLPENKHAKALLAHAQQKAPGRRPA